MILPREFNGKLRLARDRAMQRPFVDTCASVEGTRIQAWPSLPVVRRRYLLLGRLED